MEKLKLALTFVGIILAIAFGLYWVSKDAEKSKSYRIEAMSHGYGYAKGIISEKHSYKGHSIHVKYLMNKIEYECIRGWDINPQNLGVGDSISFKYSISNSQIIVTELENDF